MAVTVFLIALLRSQLVQREKTVWGFFLHINPSKIVSSHSRKDLFILPWNDEGFASFFYERLNEGKLDERDNHRNYVTLKSLIGKVFFGD